MIYAEFGKCLKDFLFFFLSLDVFPLSDILTLRITNFQAPENINFSKALITNYSLHQTCLKLEFWVALAMFIAVLSRNI